MYLRGRWFGTAALALMVGLLLASTPPVGAQIDFPDSIFLQAYNCPPGMTADTLVGDDCTPTTAGFDVRIVSLEGIAEPLTLVDATVDVSPDGSYYFVFGDELINQRGLTGSLRIEETALPAGYTSYVVLGASPAPDGSGYDFENTADVDAPDPLLGIYNFAPLSDATDVNGGGGSDLTSSDTTRAGRTVVEVDIQDGRGTITFDLEGDGTIEFTITVGRHDDE